jgi:hypothetical protein
VEHGIVSGLDYYYWVTREIYGSQAYVDDERNIVDREKSDDLLMGY